MANKKRNWILGTVGVLVALAVFGVAMGNTILARLAPDKYVLLSMLEMQKIAKKDRSDLKDRPDKERKLALNLKEIDGIYDDYKDMIQGWGVYFALANSSGGDIKIDTGLQNSGTNVVDLSIYSSSSQVGIKIPGLLDQYVMVNLESFKENYDQSVLTRYLGDIENEDVDLLNDSITLIKTSLMGQVLGDDTLLGYHLQELTTELVKNIDVKHTGTTKVPINSKEKKANTFLATIGGEDLKTFMESATKLMLNDPDIKDIRHTFQPYFETDELEQMLYHAIDQINFSDIEVVFAIDNKKRIVNTELLTAITIEDSKVKIQGEYNLSGGQNIFNGVDANLLLKTPDDASIRFSLAKDLEAKEDNFSLTSRITAGEDIALNFKLSGDLLVDKDDVSTQLDANKIELSAENFGDTIRILGSGTFKSESLKDKDIDVPKDQLLDLFSLSPVQIFDILSRLGVQFYNIGNMLDIL